MRCLETEQSHNRIEPEESARCGAEADHGTSTADDRQDAEDGRGSRKTPGRRNRSRSERLSQGTLRPIVKRSRQFSKTLIGAEEVLARSCIPFSVMKALASADSDTWAEALTTIAGGAHLDTSEIAAIQRRNRTDKMSRAQVAERDRAAGHRSGTASPRGLFFYCPGRANNAFLDTVRAFESRFRYFVQSFASAKSQELERPRNIWPTSCGSDLPDAPAAPLLEGNRRSDRD